MIRCAILGVLAVALLQVAPVDAGEFNKKMNIGDAAPSFDGLPGTDGKTYSLADFKDKDVLILCITCNHCPMSVAYEDRLIEFAKKYSSKPDSKVSLVCLNVQNLEADKLPKMIERAKEKGFNFPYVYDESQAIGKALGAAVTPEFFVFNKDRKLVYMGAMDDDQNNPKTDYLAAAVDAILKGTPMPTAETRARGCGVQYQKSK